MPEKFKSGFIALIGRPNVGKSTLLNSLAGEKIAIVTEKPQTTRNKINAVITTEGYQMAFIDTPGIHTPKSKLGEYMVKSAEKNLRDVDVAVVLAAPAPPSEKDALVLEKIKGVGCPVFLAINKIDTVKKDKLLSVVEQYTKLRDFSEVFLISALTGENLDMLKEGILKYLPEGPKYYDDDYITDQPEKQLVAEIIREKALLALDDEVPHGIAVVIEKMRKRDGREITDIDASVFCERDSHKGMIIGKNGAMLKKIGINSRGEIEALIGGKVNLQIWVKVKKDWRNNGLLVKNFGYDTKKL